MATKTKKGVTTPLEKALTALLAAQSCPAGGIEVKNCATCGAETVFVPDSWGDPLWAYRYCPQCPLPSRTSQVNS
jgi:hypothetical protein